MTFAHDRALRPLAMTAAAFSAAVLGSSAALATGAGPLANSLMGQFLMIGAIIAIFYFLLIRPQQKRLQAHQEMVAAVRRGDVAVTAGGLIGKVIRVADTEVTLELGEGDATVRVRAVKNTLQDVRSKTEPVAANDSED